ncbi:MAG TPA: hypothetical protein ENJ19_01125 [Gammaproteobacteria bacterium]|nr:hypothetical protein [Gammaproteobacteria bacterium]
MSDGYTLAPCPGPRARPHPLPFIRIILTVALFLGLAVCVRVALAAEKVKIAVNDLDAFGVSESLALSASDLLRTELFKTGFFHVTERNQMNKILAEQTFQLSGATDDDVIAVGKLLAVEWMAMGSINKLGNTLVMNVRLVDVEEARVKAAETVNANGEEGIQSAIKLLVDKIAANVPLRGKVVKIKGKEIIVSLGRQDGVRPDSVLRIERMGEIYRDPASGRVLGRDRVNVATLRVERTIGDSLSATSIIEENSAVRVDDIVLIGGSRSAPAPVSAAPMRAEVQREQSVPAAPPPAVQQVRPGHERYVRMLRSRRARDVKVAAKTIIRRSLYEPGLLAVVEDELLRGYQQRTGDGHHMDAMAWLCRVLGASGDRRYIGTLEEVQRNTRVRKLKKHSAKALARLRR